MTRKPKVGDLFHWKQEQPSDIDLFLILGVEFKVLYDGEYAFLRVWNLRLGLCEHYSPKVDYCQTHWEWVSTLDDAA